VSELKPCPFCGSTLAPMVLDENQGLYIECKDCDYGVSSNPYYQVVCRANTPFGCGASGGLRPNKEEAIEAWNERGGDANGPK